MVFDDEDSADLVCESRYAEPLLADGWDQLHSSQSISVDLRAGLPAHRNELALHDAEPLSRDPHQRTLAEKAARYRAGHSASSPICDRVAPYDLHDS